MATYLAPSFADAAYSTPNSGLISLSAPYAVTVSTFLAANDVIKYFKLPKGAKLLPGSWYIQTSADLDSATNLTLSVQVTDGTTTKTVISATTLGQGAAGIVSEIDAAGSGAAQLAWRGFVTDNNDYYVRVLVAAGPATANGTITVGCSYSMYSSAGDTVTP